MIRRPPRSTRTDTLFPYTTLFRSSKLPKALSMAPASAPLGLPPPPGSMQFQKKVWFHTWAAWLNRVPELDLMISSSDLLARSEEHTSELQSLMRSSYAVFCLKQKIEDR